ncbi:MAG: cobaltochelatase subunit CobN [Phenylobacterium sp.]|uniref:cobaltochelatase subunit CobN n=1 Tax=Phenylobacterium sp. TaxID=1871053 RepID=UPI002729274E|nr:cobaltochelatase subunit CobN [Phenylobacterium sp.]MDO8411434.1 cobaltochelatase subunit CobN [Phenylobacterium sp.]
MRAWLVFACALVLGLFSSGAEAADGAPRPRIAIVSIELAQSPNLALAAAQARAEQVEVDLFGLGGGLIPSVGEADLSSYDLVLIEGVGPQLAQFAQIIEAAKGETKVLVVNGERWIQGNVPPASLPDLQAYWTNATTENYARLLDYLMARVLGAQVAAAAPIIYPETAFYHPQAEGPFSDLAAYEAWASGRLADAAARPRIGVVFYRSLVLGENARVIDALIAEVERQGGLPLPLWRKDSAESLQVLAPPGSAGVDAIILCSNWIDYQDHAAGVRAAQALNAPLLNCTNDYSRTPQEWERAHGGFAPGRSGQLAMSELQGLVEPMMVGARTIGADGTAVIEPIDHQIRWRTARAMAWARLSRLENREKHILIPYFSEGRSEADVGSDPDSYLDAQGTLIALLNRLKAEGYDVGDAPLPDKAELSRLMAAYGSNSPTAAALETRARAGLMASIPETDYLAWWATMPAEARQAVEAQWGPPPGDVMVTTDADGRRVIAFPLLRFGKVALAPHPIWGMQEARGLASEGALTPHHQYVAFYMWAQKVWRADAFLPLFTQLSLMPGKQEGPSSTDWIGLLIGAMPHIQPTPLQANGGVANKRRANAVLIGFMPELAQAGLAPDLAQLKSDLAAADSDPDLQAEVRAKAAGLGVDRVLALDPARAPWSALAEALKRHLDEIDRAPITQGGHVLGEAPELETAARMAHAMAADAPDAPSLDQVRALARGEAVDPAADTAAQVKTYLDRIALAGREMDAVMAALSGGYVDPGPNADAIRNPDALPGGRNPYTLDPRGLPTPQAWAIGSRLADEMVQAYAETHGAPPRKAAFVLWSGETVQNEGVLESQILRLLGTRPVWNGKGQVIDVELEAPGALGRGRIDVLVTTSGTYRDHFGDKLALMHKAVALAAAADEPDNMVRRNAAETTRRLVADGVPVEVAQARALRRIFSTAPGAYSPATEFAIDQEPRWTDQALADLYARRLAHAYGDEADGGAADGQAFAENLDTVDAAVFSRSSNVFGLLDTPMPAAYLGGLNMAVRHQSGRRIETYISQLASPEQARVEPIAQALGREMRSRYLNPNWIAGMQADGYNGARYLAGFTEHLLLWDVTTPDLVTDQEWEAVRDVYVRDRYNLGLAEYFARENPAAGRKLIETLLEAADRGHWQADAATLAELRQRISSPSPGTARDAAAGAAPGDRDPTPAAPSGSSAARPTPPAPPLQGVLMEEVRMTTGQVRPVAPPILAYWPLLGALAMMLAGGLIWRPRW